MTNPMPPATKGTFGNMTIYGQRFNVLSIDFDWEVDEGEEPTDEEKQAIIADVLREEWVVATTDDDWDEDAYVDELREQITAETGWLVDAFAYEFITDDSNPES
jgi:hypothetical protein